MNFAHFRALEILIQTDCRITGTDYTDYGADYTDYGADYTNYDADYTDYLSTKPTKQNTPKLQSKPNYNPKQKLNAQTTIPHPAKRTPIV